MLQTNGRNLLEESNIIDKEDYDTWVYDNGKFIQPYLRSFRFVFSIFSKLPCNWAKLGGSTLILFSSLALARSFIAHKSGVQDDSWGVFASTFASLTAWNENARCLMQYYEEILLNKILIAISIIDFSPLLLLATLPQPVNCSQETFSLHLQISDVMQERKKGSRSA